MGLKEIINLNVKEKIILMNTIWESLENENYEIESPDWHKEVLTARTNKIKNGRAKTLTLKELKSI